MRPAFGAESVTDVTIPALIIVGAADEVVPVRSNAARYRRLITRASLVTLSDAGHDAFLCQATERGKANCPQLCRDPARVGRASVHADVNARTLAFLERAW